MTINAMEAKESLSMINENHKPTLHGEKNGVQKQSGELIDMMKYDCA